MRRYKLAQLEAFRSIVATGSFQGAAARLNVTQPTVSLRIAELESALGRKLLDRESGRVVLSAEGHLFLHYVERVLGTLDEMDRRLQTGDPLQGVLRLGASITFAISCLPDLLMQLQQAYPHLRVEVTMTTSVRLAQMLDARLIDIAFMTSQPVQGHVRTLPLAKAPLAWFVGNSGHDTGKVYTPAEVARERILTAPENTPLHMTMVRWFESSRLPLPAFSTCNDVSVVLRMVRAGYAWSVLPVCFALSDEASVLPALVPVSAGLPDLQLCTMVQDGPARDTLMVIVEMGRAIVNRRPGLVPVGV